MIEYPTGKFRSAAVSEGRVTERCVLIFSLRPQNSRFQQPYSGDEGQQGSRRGQESSRYFFLAEAPRLRSLWLLLVEGHSRESRHRGGGGSDHGFESRMLLQR